MLKLNKLASFVTVLMILLTVCCGNAQARYMQADPIGLNGGINPYVYALNNPYKYIDPSGLATALIVGAPTATNPFGHVSVATTGSGIYSFGTYTPHDSGQITSPGSSVTSFLLDQATYRDTTAYIINTTPDQEAKIISYLQSQPLRLPKVPGSDSGDTCATRSNEALRQAGLIDPSNPYTLFLSSPLPENSSMIGSFYSYLTNGAVITIPQGSKSVPAILNQFNKN